MKRGILVLFAGCCMVATGFCGEDMLGATLDGRKVLLHSDGTWDYKGRTIAAPVPETVALVDFEKSDVPANLAAGTGKKVKLRLLVRNIGTKPIKAWKANLAVKNLFNEVLFYTKVEEDEAALLPGAIVPAEFVWEDVDYSENDIYDQLASYDKEKLRLSLLDVRVVQ